MNVLAYQHTLSLDGLTMIERPDPTPGPHEVIVQVRAVSLNYRDLAIARGHYGTISLPKIPCSDAVGEVIAVGPRVERFALGDIVSPSYVPDWVDGHINATVTRRRLGGPVDGVLADRLRVDENELVRAPKHMTAIEAATLPVAGLSAWQALVTEGNLGPGSIVGVAGTGGVSLFVVQIAKMAGARVVVVGRDAEKLTRVANMGAETVHSTSDPNWERKVVATTGGGVDHFVDVVGGAFLSHAIEATRVGGTVSTMGFVAGSTATIDLLALIRRAVTLRATSGGSRSSFEALIKAYETTQMHPVVDKVFPFHRDGVLAAFTHLELGRPFGKVVVSMGGES